MFKKFQQAHQKEPLNYENEKFRFGPSEVFTSKINYEIKLKIGEYDEKIKKYEEQLERMEIINKENND